MRRRDFLQTASTLVAALALGSTVHATEPETIDANWYQRSRRFIDLPTGHVAYVEHGSGPVALFIHGYPLNGYQWRGALQRLHTHRRCIAPDMMSLGFTEVPAHQPITPKTQTEMLRMFLDKLKISRVDLVGNDSGAFVSQLFLARYPNRVRTPLLTNCDVDEDNPPAGFLPLITLAKKGLFVEKSILPQLADKNLARSARGLGSAYSYPEKLSDETIKMYFAFKSPWLGIVRQERHAKVYFFVAQVEPVKMFGNFIDPENGTFRIAVALLISATLCGLLARNITRLIRSLQRAAMAIAAGNLAARTAPALAGRSDEIALLARDFDRMAERVQLLLDQQKLLLQDISHELRSPLARLSISAELVQRGDLSAVTRMQSDIKSLEKMISDLLTLARIDASEKLSRREPVHVGRLVQRIVRDASFEGITDNKTVIQTGEFASKTSCEML
jgi:pimeloyl-ACP methyl ester carboxylesterase